MKHKIFAILAAASLVLPFSGCSFLSVHDYKEPRSYDLGLPKEAKKLPFAVELNTFASESSARYKMQIRFPDNRILFSEYNRWTRTPPVMISNFLRLSFANQAVKEKPLYSIHGTVLLFEADVEKSAARLCVKYFITSWNKEVPLISRMVILTEEFPDMKDPQEEFAREYSAAMTKAAAQLTEEVYKDLMSLYEAKK